jgi:Na+-transporting NADH:ubiquinone oxidoreductase subunit NqrD
MNQPIMKDIRTGRGCAGTLGSLGQLYVTRNLTMAFAVALAVVLRSHAALFVAIAARYITDAVDIVANLVRGVEADVVLVLVVSAVLLLVLPLAGLNWLRPALASR